MQNRNTLIIVGVGIFVVALGWWFFAHNATPQQAQIEEKPFSFDLVEGEVIPSWNFKGAYTANAQLEAQALATIKKDEGLFGKGYTDYELYISISNQYNLLGDGAKEYEYLKKALAIDAEYSGLAWHNLSVLMQRLGACKTARVAADNAVKAQPMLAHFQARLYLLEQCFPDDKEAIVSARKDIAEATDR